MVLLVQVVLNVQPVLPRVTVPIFRVILLMRSQPQTGQRMPSGHRIDSR